MYLSLGEDIRDWTSNFSW